MKTKPLFVLFFFAMAITWLTSCDPNRLYESYYSPAPKGWHNDSAAVFTVNITDIQKPYNLLVQVRNSNDYPNSNLWLFIETQSPSGKTVNDTIECQMANQNGEWMGRGWGSLYFIHFPFKKFIRFTETGEYKFSIRHGMRNNLLKGIHDIGLRVETVK